MGYEPPQRRWLERPAFLERIGAVLLDERARRRGLYDMDAIERDLAQGSWGDHTAIWRALNAELWLRALVPSPA